jgi:DNA-binding PadR family transcriptional regulator
MSRVNPADLPGNMAVLGIVIEKPNQTVQEVARLMDRRFARSQFASSTVYSGLRRMARSGKRGEPPKVRRTYTAPGDERNLDRYEATPEGVEAFSSWMFAIPNAAPSQREAMYGRIELCQLEDLPLIIEMCRAEEMIATDLYAHTTKELRKYDSRIKRRPPDHLNKARATVLYVDPMHWSARAERYEIIAERLEEIAKEAGIDLGGL